MNDPYARLLPYYDAENEGFDEDFYFYLTLLPEGTVLDLGCGTGRLALPFAQHGYQVVGVDRSPAMLDRAQKRANALGLHSLQWHQADIITLDLGQTFDLVIFPYNGFLHMLSRQAQRKALRVMAAHTGPSGIIVLDLPNPLTYLQGDDAPGLAVERTFTDERGYDVIQQTLTTIDRAAQLMEVTYLYDYVDSDGLLHRDAIPMQFRLIMALELELLIQSVLGEETEIDFIGDYEGSPYESHSPRLIAIITGATT